MSFIIRSGSILKNGTSTFRFAGCNCFWLGLLWPAQESAARYPTNGEIDDALQTAVEMGATVVRSHTLGISVGNNLSIEPSLGVFSDAAFAPIDYAVKRCNDLGLRLIIPLTDNYHYYHGGKSTFTTWRGISDETQFYTNSQVVADFEAYISHLLNHVNTLSGVALKNDPAILAWETGNELGSPTPPVSWTTIIATYLKSIDSNHLVIDGSYGVDSAALLIASVDLYSNHSYPLIISQITSDAAATCGANKAYLIGELDWRANVSPGAGSAAIDGANGYLSTYAAKVTVTAPDSYAYHVQFRQLGLTLTQGTTYTLSFSAKADVARTMQIAVQGANSPYTLYYQPANFLLGTSYQQYSFSFTMNAATDAHSMLCFNVAQVVSNVWLDTISLAPAGGGNLLVNGTFETGSLAPWALQVRNVTPDSLSSYEASVEGDAAISGDLFWSLMPHRDSYGFDLQNDGYSLYYPAQDASEQANMQMLRTHAYTMAGLATPAPLVPAAPMLNALTVLDGFDHLCWRGVVGAQTYSVEQATASAVGPWTVVSSGMNDLETPVTVSAVSPVWYRVRGLNTAGVAGAYSNVVGG